MTEDNHSSVLFNKPQTIPKPYRVSKMNETNLLADNNNHNRECESSTETKPTRFQTKKATTIGLEKANLNIAIERAHLESNRYYKGEEIPITINQEHFRIYGPGIYLFFAFIWKLSLLFLLLTLISLIPMIYNYLEGTRFTHSIDSLDVYISRVSISNFYGDDPSLTLEEQVNNTRVPKLINCVCDLVSMFLVMVFYFYWTGKSERVTEEIKRTFKLANYHTIELTKFHEDTTDYDIFRFFEQYGTVTEVAPVKNYSETIELSKEIYECETEIKELKLELEVEDEQLKDEEQQNKYNKKLSKLEQNLEKLYKELYLEEKKSHEEIIKYYITFSSPIERANTLRKFNKIYDTYCLCLKTIPEEFLLKGEIVEVSPCHDQPGEIIWENVHVTWKTRWLRALVQFVVLLVIIFVGFFVISTLDVLTPPSTLESIDTSSYTSTTILSETNSTIIESWCLKNTDLVSITSESELTTLCQSYITQYYTNLLITYSITVFVILIKTLLKKLVIWIAKFQRYTQHTEQSIDVMKNLVIIYIITTVVIGFLLQANLFGIRFKNIVPELVNDSMLKENAALMADYSVLENSWYIDIGYQIWLTWLILSLTPHLYMPLYYYLMECINYKLAHYQKLQKNMDKLLQPIEFELEDHYANIIMIFFVGIVFSGGMPCMVVVSFFGIITRYCYLKFLFVRFSRVPKSIDEHLNNAVLSYFPWVLCAHFLMTIWMYSVSGIFAYEESIFSSWVIIYYYLEYQETSSSIIQFISKILEMMIASYYYTIVAIVMVVCIMVKRVVYDFVINICKKESEGETNIDDNNNNDIHLNDEIENSANDLINNSVNNDFKNNKIVITSQRGITNSYRIENNPDYFEILSIKENIKKKIENGEFDEHKLFKNGGIDGEKN